MNAKRWTALGVAGAVLVFSIIAQIVTLFTTFSLEEEMSLMEIFHVESGLVETVLEDGDRNERIAVLHVDGPIIDGGASTPFTPAGFNYQDFLTSLEAISLDNTVQGIVLAVNSPGGGVYESAEITRWLNFLQEEHQIPLYVSFGPVAASGGYFISAGADKIFTSPHTITGSIGVAMQTFSFAGFMEEHGIEDNTVASGDNKTMGSATQHMSEESRAILQSMIDNAFDEFVAVVADGRGMSEEEIREIADGRIYDGRQAVEIGLADEFGDLSDAIWAMQTNYGLENAEIFTFHRDEGWNSLFWARVDHLLQSNNVFGGQVNQLLGDNQTPRLMFMFGE